MLIQRCDQVLLQNVPLFDLPHELVSIICDNMLSHRDRVMLSLSCHHFRSLHAHTCARHTSFQELRKSMRNHVRDKHLRRHLENDCVVAYILNPVFYCRWLYNFVIDEYWFESIRSPIMHRIFTAADGVPLSCYAIVINGTEATLARHPRHVGNDAIQSLVLGGMHDVPKFAWDLYVRKYQSARTEVQ